MNHPEMRLATIVSNPYAENAFVAWKNEASECLIIDPGHEPEKICAVIEQHELTPRAILNTHGHFDHIAGNEAMKAAWPDAPLVIGQGDVDKLTDTVLNLSAKNALSVTSPPADITVAEGDVFSRAGFDLEVLEIGGHSAGHVVFVWKGAPYVVFGGDNLFAGGMGRTDFSDGNFQQLVDGIHSKLFTLPEDTIVLPGHGPATTIGQEKLANPFVGYPSGFQD